MDKETRDNLFFLVFLVVLILGAFLLVRGCGADPWDSDSYYDSEPQPLMGE